MLCVLIIVIVCGHSDGRVDVSYCSHDHGLIILVEIVAVEVVIKFMVRGFSFSVFVVTRIATWALFALAVFFVVIFIVVVVVVVVIVIVIVVVIVVVVVVVIVVVGVIVIVIVVVVVNNA